MDERTTKNIILNEKLSLCEDENTTFVAQVFELSSRIRMLESNKITLIEGPSTSINDKRKFSIFEEELEDKLKVSESKLVASLKTTSNLKKDLSRIREE